MAVTRFTSILAVAVLWSACARDERVVRLGQAIRHDDFFYTVERVEKADRLGALTPAGQFYLVTFAVDNRAKRVAHQWGNDIAFLVDERGRRFENQPGAQRAAAALRQAPYRERYVTSAGDTERALLVFDVPRDVTEPWLKVRGELLMGDVFDLNQYARTRVRLF